MKTKRKFHPVSLILKLARKQRNRLLKLSMKYFDPIQRMENKKIRGNFRKWMESGGPYIDDTMQEVAESLEITVEQLSFFFHSEFGENFLVWRKNLRVEKAGKLMLAHPELTIKEIMQSVGIYDRANFRKMFLEKYGLSPEHWRKRSK